MKKYQKRKINTLAEFLEGLAGGLTIQEDTLVNGEIITYDHKLLLPSGMTVSKLHDSKEEEGVIINMQISMDAASDFYALDPEKLIMREDTYYKTRNGLKVYVYKIDPEKPSQGIAATEYRVHGRIISKSKDERGDETFTINGMWSMGNTENEKDLVAYWEEE